MDETFDRSHFDGKHYFNPSGHNGRSLADLPKFFATPRARWPRRVAVTPMRPAVLAAANAVATFIGHSTVLIQTPEGTILTDPVYSSRASPVRFAGPRRVRDPGVRFEDLPKIDVVLLSHNHYDHCDLRTLRRIRRQWEPLFITTLGNARLLRGLGATRIEELDWWQTASTSPVPITVTPAQHFSGRTLWDRNRALWGSFVIDAPGCRIFFAADTGYGVHFSAIRERCGAIDLAFLPIGAYEPRWFMQDVHMNPADAVRAHIDVGAKQSVAIHFGTFQLTTEAIDAPVIVLAEALAQARIATEAFRVLEAGESLGV